MGKGKIKRAGSPNKKYLEKTSRKYWTNGVIKKQSNNSNSLNYVMHYASPCVWEGIRSYKKRDGSTEILALKSHITRLFESAKILNFEIPFTYDEVINAIRTLVKTNGGGDLYIRPIAYLDIDAITKFKVKPKISLDIYINSISTLYKNEKGIKTIISSFKRGYPQYNMQAKTPTNYHFLNDAKHELENVDDIFLTDNEGYITGTIVANVWIFKNNAAYTPPNNGSILPGITRKIISDLLSKFKDSNHLPNNIMEKRLTRADMYTADCIIICGTYVEIVPVDYIDTRYVNSSNSYIYKFLKNKYEELIRN